MGSRRGKIAGNNHDSVEFRTELFEAAGLVDGGTDYSEVEPLGRANIPVVDFSQMECNAKIYFAPPLPSSLAITKDNAGDRIACSPQCCSAAGRWCLVRL